MFLIRRTYTEEGTDLWQYITQGLNDLNVGRTGMVNHNWDGMKQQLRDAAVDIEKGLKRITG